MNKQLFLSLAALALLSSCSDTIEKTKEVPGTNPEFSNSQNLPIPSNTDKQAYKVLLFGNSHIVGLAPIIKEIVKAGLPEKSILLFENSSQYYLDERLSDGSSLDILQSEAWTHVIFQAQKYSQSGQVSYPIDGAKKWLQHAKEQRATPILFPEHPQRGNSNEGKMVHNIHVEIAQQESGCVAPIGLAWDKALLLKPELKLHSSDGNHASDIGRLLSALVFYQVITGASADLVPWIETIDLVAETQDFLGQVASQVIAEYPPCEY